MTIDLFGHTDRTGESPYLTTGALFSSCRLYRYALWRTWGRGEGAVAFVGLNPSTADETVVQSALPAAPAVGRADVRVRGGGSMNWTTAACGHPVTLIAAATCSATRRKCEQRPCERCRDSLAFAVFPPPGLLPVPETWIAHSWEDADDKAAEWNADAPEGAESRIAALTMDLCCRCKDMIDQHGQRATGLWYCGSCYESVFGEE